MTMKRRKFITLLGGAAVAAWPLAARAQQGNRVRRIGWLSSRDENDPVSKSYSALTQSLADLGWTDGRNARIDLRWGGGDNNRIRAFAQELVRSQPDVIVTSSTPTTIALQRERRRSRLFLRALTIPSPAASSRGSTSRAGTSPVSPSTKPRWEASGLSCSRRSRRGSSGPQSCSILTPPASAYMPSLETAARSLKVDLVIAPVRSDGEIETAIIALGREPGGGLFVMPDVFTIVHRAPIILAAARNNVPAVYPQSYFVREGGLLSYGPDEVDGLRRAASYVDRILRGEKPGDLPVQLPTKFEMVVNRKAATALGLAVPANRNDGSKTEMTIRRVLSYLRPHP
jgi:putative ABC transport system substrate-binding protein